MFINQGTVIKPNTKKLLKSYKYLKDSNFHSSFFNNGICNENCHIKLERNVEYKHLHEYSQTFGPICT